MIQILLQYMTAVFLPIDSALQDSLVMSLPVMIHLDNISSGQKLEKEIRRSFSLREIRKLQCNIFYIHGKISSVSIS